MRHRKLMWVVGLGLVAAAGIQLWDWYHAELPVKGRPLYSVSFQGYSNSPSGDKWAVLMVTNRDVCILELHIPARLKFLGHSDLEARRILFDNNPLPRAAACRIAIQLPPSSGAWSFEDRVTRYTRREELADHLPGWLDRWVPSYGEGPAAGYVETGWINQ